MCQSHCDILCSQVVWHAHAIHECWCVDGGVAHNLGQSCRFLGIVVYYGKTCFYKIGLNFATSSMHDLDAGWLDQRARELTAGPFHSIDDWTPRSAMMCGSLAVAIFCTKPPEHGKQNQELHLIKLAAAPEDVAKVFHGRCAIYKKPLFVCVYVCLCVVPNAYVCKGLY